MLPILGDGMNQLVIFRAIQGLGGAGLLPWPLSSLLTSFLPLSGVNIKG
ncbi:MAG: hypothetical protein R2865_11200 [Deinococcales bacterium]